MEDDAPLRDPTAPALTGADDGSPGASPDAAPDAPLDPPDSPPSESGAAATDGPAAVGKAPGTTAAPGADSTPDDGYEPAAGFDRATTEAKRTLEPVVYDKVVSDLTHVVWAYGIIFALFAVYAITLWRRARSLSADVEALRRELDGLRERR